VKRSARYRTGHVFREEKKLGPDKWFLRIADGSGKKKKIELGTLEELRTRRDALKAAEQFRLKANPDNPFSNGVTFGALLDRYVAEEMPKRWSTSDSYGAWIRAYIKPQWGEYHVSEVKPYGVEQWLKGLSLAPKSKGHIKTVMLSVFNCAMRWELVPMGINPMSLVRVPGGSKRQSVSRVLSADEVIRLISHIEREPFRTAAWLAVCLGLEPSVLFALQWQDVNLEAMSINIQRGIVCNHVDRAKNEYREAPLPLDEKLIEMLKSWKAVSEFSGDSDWVFASPYRGGEDPYSPRHVAEDHLWPASKAAGLGDKIGWRSFRRTYSSLLRQLGVDIKVQQDLMRHADIRTTMNLYTESFSGDMRKAHSAVVGRFIQ